MNNKDPIIQVTLTLNAATGHFNVSGPLDNPIFVLGMLEMAKVRVIEFGEQAKRKLQEQQPGGLVVPPTVEAERAMSKRA